MAFTKTIELNQRKLQIHFRQPQSQTHSYHLLHKKEEEEEEKSKAQPKVWQKKTHVTHIND